MDEPWKCLPVLLDIHLYCVGLLAYFESPQALVDHFNQET